MASHNDLGKHGESIAASYLISNGYTLLEKNYRFEKAEIDIICTKLFEIIFVEVKTRSSNYYNPPSFAVDDRKQELLKNAALNYIEFNEVKLEPRFDIISIVIEKEIPTIEHIEDAFWG